MPRNALLLVCLAFWGAAPALFAADAAVRITIYVDEGFPPLDQQKWYRLFTDLKVSGLELRPGRGNEQPAVETTGTEQNPSYRVIGVLTGKGQLFVPGKRFTLQDSAGIDSWLKELRKWGPQGSPEGQPLYGLNLEQMKGLLKDFGQTVTFDPTDMTATDALERLRKGLSHEILFEKSQLEAINDGDKVSCDLTGLSTGTAIAYVLRAYGLTLKPERDPSGDIRIRVVASQKAEETWPIGRPLVKRSSEVLPPLLEQLTVEIEPTPLSDVLDAVKARLKVPFLIDRNSLLKHDIDLAQVEVNFPRKKTWYQSVLRTVLNQAKLKFEVRQDDAGKPFLWITTQIP